MEEKEKFAIDFSVWKDANFDLQRSGNYYPKYDALSMYDAQPYTLIQVMNFYKEQLSINTRAKLVSYNGIEHFKADLINNNSIIELASMKYSIKKDDLPALIELFIAEQKTFDKKYSGFSDCIKHFTYWLPNNIKKLTTQTPTTVKSKGKILGI